MGGEFEPRWLNTLRKKTGFLTQLRTGFIHFEEEEGLAWFCFTKRQQNLGSPVIQKR